MSMNRFRKNSVGEELQCYIDSNRAFTVPGYLMRSTFTAGLALLGASSAT